MNGSAPIVRRHPEISQQLDALSARAVHLLFGPAPTPDQEAAYAMPTDLGPPLRRLTDLPDADLREVLRRLCLRVLRV